VIKGNKFLSFYEENVFVALPFSVFALKMTQKAGYPNSENVSKLTLFFANGINPTCPLSCLRAERNV
jgi:hypothetical protein